MSRTTELSPTETSAIDAGSDDAPIPGGRWYEASTTGAELVYDLPAGALGDANYVNVDLLLDDEAVAMFSVSIREADDAGLLDGVVSRLSRGDHAGPNEFKLVFQLLPQCAARARIDLDLVDQTRWMCTREGAWLKPVVGGDRIDLDAADRIRVSVSQMAGESVRWCQTPLRLTREREPPMEDPALPEGRLLDGFGQSAVRDWDGRTATEAELVNRLRRQLDRAGTYEWPERFSRWGGDGDVSYRSTGYFRLHSDGDGRWWLLDPDGHPFWSSGLGGVRPCVKTVYRGLENALAWLPDEDGPFADAYSHSPCDDTHLDPAETVNYLAANFIRAFGADRWRERWRDVATAQLRRSGFNTIGVFPDVDAAANSDVPYVRSVRLRFPRTPAVCLDFPDVFHPDFPADARRVANQLEDTVTDPSMVGYTLGTEPEWAARSPQDESPAVSMLYQTDACASRRALAEYLREKHAGDLAAAWDMDVTYDDVASGAWSRTPTEAARSDLHEFSSVMVDRYYDTVSEACRAVDGNHLNLGTQFFFPPQPWMLAGVRNFDVLTINVHSKTIPDEYGQMSRRLGMPVLVAEWSSGALDVGLPAAGLCEVGDQRMRGDHFRYFQEDAASKPWCVGAHYFRMYDMSAMGRADGEAYNNGLLDVCHRPYEPLVEACRRTHRRLYDVAAGATPPVQEPPEEFTYWQ